MLKRKECKKVKKLLPLFITDYLQPKEQEMVKGHLSRCVDCQEEIKVYQSLHDLLVHQPRVEKDELFWKDYWREIETRIGLDRPKRFILQPTGILFLLRMAAVFLVGLAVGYLGYNFFRKPILDLDQEPFLVQSPLPSVEVPAEIVENKLLGVKFQPVSKALSKHLELPPNVGVVISDFLSQSPVRAAGLEPGDIILELNGMPLQFRKPGMIVFRLVRKAHLIPEIPLEMCPHIYIDINIDKLSLDKLNLKFIHEGKIITKEISIKSDKKKQLEGQEE